MSSKYIVGKDASYDVTVALQLWIWCFFLTLYTMSLSSLYLWFPLPAFSAQAPLRAGASQLWLSWFPNARPLGALPALYGASVGITANAELKGTDFYQITQSCEGRHDICLIFFQLPRGECVCRHLVCGSAFDSCDHTKHILYAQLHKPASWRSWHFDF